MHHLPTSGHQNICKFAENKIMEKYTGIFGNGSRVNHMAAEHPNPYTIAALYFKVKECSKYREATDIDKANGSIDVMNILPSILVIA